MKAKFSYEAKKLLNIPNIGPAMVRDFALLGIATPADLKKKNPYVLFKNLCIKTETNQDPCVLDTFIAAVDFMHGAPPRPWWYYTKERKAQMRK